MACSNGPLRDKSPVAFATSLSINVLCVCSLGFRAQGMPGVSLTCVLRCKHVSFVDLCKGSLNMFADSILQAYQVLRGSGQLG